CVRGRGIPYYFDYW
nr:immunoglobulin heavy chain junction region [Mus musculus]MBK4195304.1 immunoglobulin heavy chain junction region [Mus musculus]